MKGKIVLFVCFIFIGSLLFGQSTEVTTSSDENASSEQETEETKISMIGFGFQTSGAKDAEHTNYVMKLNFTKGKKMPLKGKLYVDTSCKTHLLQLSISDCEAGVVADVVKEEEQVVDGVTKMVIGKIGSVKLKETTTKFKDKVQTGKVSIESLSVEYDTYLNVLPDEKVEASKTTERSSSIDAKDN